MAMYRRVVCWISKATRAQAHVRSRSPTHTHTHIHKHAHKHLRARARKHTHTQKICNMYCFSTAKLIRESASILRIQYRMFLYPENGGRNFI
jgi:hypothetical protein